MTVDLTRRRIMLKGAATPLAGGGLVAVPGVDDADGARCASFAVSQGRGTLSDDRWSR
jgi:hypothetical protein